jgi:predicted glycoside hydrolase/deacetylase ChbG (UPF0249 family)
LNRLVITADDFGLSEEVNEAIEVAHCTGLLRATGRMVAGPAASDAIRRARRLPELRIGHHIVLVEGRDEWRDLGAASRLPNGGVGRFA